jgi:ribosomal protein S18 acetylase RimI-like enzyme
MPVIRYRRAVPDDAATLFDILREAFTREGAESMTPHPIPDAAQQVAFLAYLAGDPQSEGVLAQSAGRPVGFGIAAQRGATRWLVFLFVRPAYQGAGIGSTILARLFSEHPGPKATLVDVATPRAIGLYLGHGLLPQQCVLSLWGRPPPDGALAGGVDLVEDGLADDALADLDRATWGGDRAADHAYRRSQGFSFRAARDPRGKLLGYGCWSPSGRLGPVACGQASDVHGVVAACLTAMAAEGHVEVSALVPASNRPALHWLLGHRFRVRGMEMVMADGAYGDWGCCLIHRAALP